MLDGHFGLQDVMMHEVLDVLMFCLGSSLHRRCLQLSLTVMLKDLACMMMFVSMDLGAEMFMSMMFWVDDVLVQRCFGLMMFVSMQRFGLMLDLVQSGSCGWTERLLGI